MEDDFNLNHVRWLNLVDGKFFFADIPAFNGHESED